jgi:hypothetical protein
MLLKVYRRQPLKSDKKSEVREMGQERRPEMLSRIGCGVTNRLRLYFPSFVNHFTRS